MMLPVCTLHATVAEGGLHVQGNSFSSLLGFLKLENQVPRGPGGGLFPHGIILYTHLINTFL